MDFGNEFTQNVITFGVDITASRHSYDHEIKFLVLVEGPTDDVNDSVGETEKKLSINITYQQQKKKKKKKLSLHNTTDESCLYVNETQIYKFNGLNNIAYLFF